MSRSISRSAVQIAICESRQWKKMKSLSCMHRGQRVSLTFWIFLYFGLANKSNELASGGFLSTIFCMMHRNFFIVGRVSTTDPSAAKLRLPEGFFRKFLLLDITKKSRGTQRLLLAVTAAAECLCSSAFGVIIYKLKYQRCEVKSQVSVQNIFIFMGDEVFSWRFQIKSNTKRSIVKAHRCFIFVQTISQSLSKCKRLASSQIA